MSLTFYQVLSRYGRVLPGWTVVVVVVGPLEGFDCGVWVFLFLVTGSHLLSGWGNVNSSAVVSESLGRLYNAEGTGLRVLRCTVRRGEREREKEKEREREREKERKKERERERNGGVRSRTPRRREPRVQFLGHT